MINFYLLIYASSIINRLYKFSYYTYYIITLLYISKNLKPLQKYYTLQTYIVFLLMYFILLILKKD